MNGVVYDSRTQRGYCRSVLFHIIARKYEKVRRVKQNNSSISV